MLVTHNSSAADLDAAAANGAQDVGNDDRCSCFNNCKIIERIPPDHGLMITLQDDDTDNQDKCRCLKLESQQDTNLTSFHPNIYIPKPLLSYPSHLKRHGGGGSGVTVFGGYHPKLGSLVMKHGGFKDLIELVSLATIEREVGVRGGWKIDCLIKRRERILMGEEDSKNSEQCSGWLTTHHGSLGIFTTSHASSSSLHSDAVTNNALNTRESNLKPSRRLFNRMKTLQHFLTFKNILRQPFCIDQQQLSEEVAKINQQITQIRCAMSQIQCRIPSFKMIYISPMHFRERENELINSGAFCTLRRSKSLFDDSNSVGGSESETRNVVSDIEKEDYSEHISNNENRNGKIGSSNGINRRRHTSVITRGSTSRVNRKGREICLFGAEHVESSSFNVASDHVDVCFGGSYRYKRGGVDYENEAVLSLPHTCRSANGSNGYSTLKAFVHQLQEHQIVNNWKVTLAQQTIGTTFENGDINKPKSARTASSLLYEGKLQGKLLHHLIDEEIKMIRNMQLLTMPEEANVLEQVKNEYCELCSRGGASAEDVSDLMDCFVGKAIRKNFHPKHGRFVMLRQFGRDLRHGKIHLTEEEVQPAMHLENLFYNQFEDEDEFIGGGYNAHGKKLVCDTFSTLKDDDLCNLTVTVGEGENVEFRVGSSLSKSFHQMQMLDRPIFANGLNQWRSLLELSLSMKHPYATNCVWTCGLTDGGLHNLFLDEDQMWAFDLGEPSLEPIPAFLTKFLMSFFHTLGKFAPLSLCRGGSSATLLGISALPASSIFH